MPPEFDIIEQLAARQPVRRAAVATGIGDDAAVLDIPAGQQLIVSTDTLNSGVHFPADTAAQDVGYKSLAVNLSDLAAMGAQPLAANLSLSLPRHDRRWVRDFAAGFFALAEQHNVQLTGGDTVRGALSVSVTVLGVTPQGAALHRRGGNVGDAIYVSGTLGDAAAALLHRNGDLSLNDAQRRRLYARLNRPRARLALGVALRGVASSCIDVSDGLTADLGHLLEADGLGATIDAERLPLSAAYREIFDRAGGWQPPLSGGDDYELCFTVAAAKAAALPDEVDGAPLTRVGIIEAQPGIRLNLPDGTVEQASAGGYEHFR